MASMMTFNSWFGRKTRKMFLQVLMTFLQVTYGINFFAGAADRIDDNFFRKTDQDILYGSLNARKLGVMGDGVSDDTLSIQHFLDTASSQKKDAFFPPGEYIISENIFINEYTNIYGSANGITALKAPESKCLKIYLGCKTPAPNFAIYTNVSITNMFFDGVRINFTSLFYKRNLLLSNCVFLTSQRPYYPPSPVAQYLSWDRVKDGVIRNLIFLRSQAIYGLGCGFFKTVGVRIHDNIFGLDLSNITWLASQYQGFATWNNLLEKLQFIKKYHKMENDQGHFRACIYGNHDDKIVIERNIFNGSPFVRHIQDHVIYLKGFDGLLVIGNYARGWPSDPSGGFKMRNGENLVVTRNYLVDTAVLLYTHNETSSYDYLHPGLSNVLVYGNHLVEYHNVGKWGTGLSYLEPHNVGLDTNIVFSSNVFEISGLNETSRPICIHITNGNQREHHVFKDNVYFGTSIPVTLAAASDTPMQFEKNVFNLGLVLKYVDSSIPNLVIPVYRHD